MKITLITAGKVRERFYRDAIDEYLKRLSRYAKVEIIEVKDEKTPETLSEKEQDLIKDIEGERILARLSRDSYTYALAIEGKQHDSVGFSNELDSLMTRGNDRFTFIIGGSLGLSDKVLRASDELLSFSKMTFPHQLMRVILLEQIYRAMRIMHNEPYHK
ncbi:MAG: 23S rRNA (pseudouridine(1915)-N(3))-methyltransferase RlmH [Lachnospiraceae bacterium]|jgi:23S rRNA (pseudouridine1915-N3)-methyltransferase|nr:23S rRNA (pseudouridine(1915)-N(3))-methyltransferase RlmH [Lachnospiraceae bacterium]MEE3460722.1 23S rRNA (pseudouridine(1915)-N(3))-methyltransferase RlmH [Lachnospiraceae bacterium]